MTHGAVLTGGAAVVVVEVTDTLATYTRALAIAHRLQVTTTTKKLDK